MRRRRASSRMTRPSRLSLAEGPPRRSRRPRGGREYPRLTRRQGATRSCKRTPGRPSSRALSRNLSRMRDSGTEKSSALTRSSGILAEREGFEPSVPLRVHMISNHAPSATRSSLPERERESSPLYHGGGQSSPSPCLEGGG